MKLNGSTWWNGRLKTIDSSAFSSRFIFLFLFFVSLLWWGFVVGYCEHRPTLFILRLTASFETCQHANCKFSVTTVKLVMQICASLSDPNFFACHFFFFFWYTYFFFFFALLFLFLSSCSSTLSHLWNSRISDKFSECSACSWPTAATLLGPFKCSWKRIEKQVDSKQEHRHNHAVIQPNESETRIWWFNHRFPNNDWAELGNCWKS